jgi:drug/metabolite transporter (DMT)-like permease
VLGGQHPGELVHVGFDQLLEFEHHPRAALRVGRRPGRLRFVGGIDGALELVGGAELHLRLNLAAVGIEDVAGSAARGIGFAGDEMVDVTQHRRMPLETDSPAEQRPLAGIALRLATALLLAVMFALVKLAATRGVNVIESLFYRQAGSALCAIALIAAGTGLASLRTRRVGAHVVRMVLGVTAMGLNFMAMIMLPLAEATSIGFTVPIFATVLAALLLGEPTGKWRWGAVAAGFIGVLVIIQPGRGEVATAGAAIAIAAAIMTAAVTIAIRHLGATEKASTTVFWFAVSSLVPLGLLMMRYGGMHDGQTWAILAGLAVVGGLAQLTLTGALRLAPVALVMPMDYTSLLWATLLGFWIFAELPTPWVWAGAPIIIASGLVIVWREHRLSRRSALAAAAAVPR